VTVDPAATVIFWEDDLNPVTGGPLQAMEFEVTSI
jgi:hypothetical protein